MNVDITLRLERDGPLRAIKITKPALLASTLPGEFKDLPANLWSENSVYFPEKVDVGAISAWLRDCLGASIRELLQRRYPGEDRILRIMITADETLLPEMIKTPWELLEAPDLSQGMVFGERTSVIRVLSPDGTDAVTDRIAGRPLRIGVLWANPDGNIPGLTQHLHDLKQFVRARPLELEMNGPIEFTEPDAVCAQFAGLRSDIIYHLGHAEQPSGHEVQLRIGPLGNAAYLNLTQFFHFLQRIHLPRILLMNSCGGMAGYELDSYLGAALTYAKHIDAVIAMQSEISFRAARSFAGAFFQGIADNKGLAASLKMGRIAIQRREPLNEPVHGGGPAGISFVPFIPVLVQNTALDLPLEVDITERNLRRLLLKFRSEMEDLALYLDRVHDPGLANLLKSPPQRRVAFITGAENTGKTTSLKRAILPVLARSQFIAGDRYLYYDVRRESLSGDDDQHILQMLISMALQSAPLTDSLASELKRSDTLKTNALSILAAWLQEMDSQGLRYRVCLDHVPPQAAAKIGQNAFIIKAGLVLVVSENPNVNPEWGLECIEVQPLNMAEIGDAVVKQYGSPNQAQAEAIRNFSNGLPYFAAGYLWRGSHPSQKTPILAKTFLDARQPALSEQELDILRFVSLCNEPVPESLMSDYPSETVTSLVNDHHLLIRTAGNAYKLPEVMREYLKDQDPDEMEHHRLAFNGFLDVADPEEEAQREADFGLVSRWYREAFMHRLSMAELQEQNDPADAMEILESAHDVAKKLHARYVKQQEIGAARTLWEEYLDVANSLHQYDERDVNVLYADCLIRSGEYGDAETRLENVTLDSVTDPPQLTALFLWSNLIKERGRAGERSLRIELLQKALEVVERLKPEMPDSAWLKDQIANLEHTLGNVLGFGRDANVSEALRHLAAAQKMFEALNSPLQFRTINEQIEIKRYNNLLSPQEIEAAQNTLRDNLLSLVTRDMRFDAVHHFYELGRLEKDPGKRAEYFRHAFERAGGLYQPDNWHAAINWRIAQVEAGELKFTEAAVHLEEYASKLTGWLGRAWSRRKRREALLFLAEGYAAAGDHIKMLKAAEEAWKMVQQIAEIGEGRMDATERVRAARIYGLAALDAGLPENARVAAKAINAEISSALPEPELRKLFQKLGQEAP